MERFQKNHKVEVDSSDVKQVIKKGSNSRHICPSCGGKHESTAVRLGSFHNGGTGPALSLPTAAHCVTNTCSMTPKYVLQNLQTEHFEI